VIFDEPELHLHPELSYRLIQTLRAAGVRNQFIFCTHSAEIISASLDNSVVFIAPPKEPPINQAMGVDFFMLCDADAVPPGRDIEKLNQLSQGRMQVLKRYHLENYFLEPEVIARIFEPFETEASDRSWLRDPAAINDRLREIAREILSYTAALIVSAHFRERAGNVDLMPKGCHGKTTDELIALFEVCANAERNRIADALSQSELAAFTRATMTELEGALSDETWKVKIPGRPILQIFCSGKHSGLDFGRFKTAYIRAASEIASSPFAEIESMFARFSNFDPTASQQSR
jgi:AAA ATPase domain